MEFTNGPADTALLTASCAGVAPHIMYVAPTAIDYSSSGNPSSATVKMRLANVQSCGSVTHLRQPCVTSVTDWPALFYCAWHGQATSTVLTPVKAEREFDASDDGVKLGAHAFVTCPIPSLSALESLHGIMDGSVISLNVSVSHFDPAKLIPFDGLPGGDSVQFRGLLAPPPPSTPPPLPPSPSPPAPPSPPPCLSTSDLCSSASDGVHQICADSGVVVTTVCDEGWTLISVYSGTGSETMTATDDLTANLAGGTARDRLPRSTLIELAGSATLVEMR